MPGSGGEVGRHFHKMGVDQWLYNNSLAKDGNFKPISSVVQKLYDAVHKERAQAGPVKYRIG